VNFFTVRTLYVDPQHWAAQYGRVSEDTKLNFNETAVRYMTTPTLKQVSMHQRYGSIAASPVCLWVDSVV
jgi:hypothetical protein